MFKTEILLQEIKGVTSYARVDWAEDEIEGNSFEKADAYCRHMNSHSLVGHYKVGRTVFYE